MSGSIWRKTDSSWEKIRTLWRKTDSGWERIKSVWRKTDSAWERVFSGLQVPTPTTNPAIRNAGGNDIDGILYFARVGNTLYGYRGVWANDPTSYTDRWRYSTTSGGPYLAFDPAQTNTTLSTNLSMDGYYLIYEVRATNDAGSSGFVNSQEARVVKYFPESLQKPIFDTTAAEVGQTITGIGTGNTYWKRTTNITDDTSPTSYTYLWTYYPGGGTPGATNTNNTYTPVAADVGKRLQFTVTAINTGGTASRTSDPTVEVGEVPVADVNPTLTRVNYPGNGANTITVGYTLRGNTGQWTPNPTNVYWGFQYGTSTDVTNGTGIAFENGTDTSENQNHDYTVLSTVGGVSLIGKYIRFYTIPEQGGAQAPTFNTGWIGPVYAAPGTPGAPSIVYSSPYSQTEVNVTATWTDASSYYEYTVQYYNPSTLQWVNLFSKTTSGAISSSFRAPIGTFNYRVRNDNGDGIYVYSSEVSVTLTAPYQFSFGNKLYPNTNGWIGIDQGHNGLSVPSTGRGFAVFPGDFEYDYMYQWSGGNGTSASDNVKYVLSYNGYRFNTSLIDANRITWQAIFYTNTEYADFKIIYKGSNISGGVTIGFYNNGVVTSGLPGPYTVATGTTFRVYYNNTGTNSFGISFSEILNTAPNNVMLNLSTPTSGTLDDGYWDITTAANRYNIPSVSFGTSANTSTSLSIPFTEANSCASIDYVVRTTSHTGTVISGPTNDTDTPLNVSGLTANTNYYITATPKNYLGQTGNNVQFTTITAPGQPTVTFSNVTTSAFDVSWSATGATSYDVDIYTTSGQVSLSGYPKLNTTTTSASPFGLSSGTQYTVSVFPKNSGGTGTGRIVTQRTLYDARTPTFGTLTRGDGKISSSVTNYDTNWTFSGSASVGTFTWGTASGATRPFEVTGLSDNQSTTVTVTTTRTDYANGSGTQTGSSLASALTPSFGTNTSVTGGFNGSVTNYDTNYTWGISTNSGSVSWGTASGSTRPFSVTGLSAGGSATVTVTTSRTGYKNGSNTTTGTASSNVAPSGGSLNNLTLSGTDGRIGSTYSVSINTEATGTPSPTKTYQWQYYRASTSAWTNLTNSTSSSYTIPWNDTSSTEGTIAIAGRDLRCVVTWTNSAGSQSVASNQITISLPTITGVTASFSTTTPYVTYLCYGYNFRSIASTLTYGTTSPPTTVGSVIYSASNNSTPPISRVSNQGGDLYYYFLEVTPYDTVGTQSFPSSPYSSGVSITTATRRNNATNRSSSPINVYGTGSG